MRVRSLSLILVGWGPGAGAATIAAILIALALLAGPAQAQEATIQEVAAEAESVTSVEQNGEDSKVAAEAGDAVAQAGDGETGAVAKTNNTVARAQRTQSLNITQRQGNRQVAAAQQAGGSGGSARADDPLQGVSAQVDNPDSQGVPDRVGPISVANCTFAIGQDASVTLRGTSNAQVVISDTNNNFDLTNSTTQLTITGPGGGDLQGTNLDQLGTGLRTIIDSTGITCGDDGNNGNGRRDNDGRRFDDGRRDLDGDLDDLSCERLLQLFRSEADVNQYEDSFDFNSVEICLRREILDGTAADGKLPDTGGPAILGLAVLGLTASVAGASVIRFGRRRGD